VEEGKYDGAVLIVGDRLCYRVFASINGYIYIP
jgi:hypothetical protein